PEQFRGALRRRLVDAALVDVGTPGDVTRRVIALAVEYPSIPFFGIAPFRAADAPFIALCARHDFVDVLADGVDAAALWWVLAARSFSSRFAAALRDPPASLGLTTALQLATWRRLVGDGGRVVRTIHLARALGVTREHLSRTFASAGAPNLKRVIDLVRLLAAAELAKNPGYDLRDVARLLGFTSPTLLSRTAQRVVGTRAPSLAALRAVDLVSRFVRGRGN
ncbi:MAG: helix-turn-helix domain-containing protein, partial [Gemmatimonadaceae bacterium]